jgi:hypothetical protein
MEPNYQPDLFNALSFPIPQASIQQPTKKEKHDEAKRRRREKSRTEIYCRNARNDGADANSVC